MAIQPTTMRFGSDTVTQSQATPYAPGMAPNAAYTVTPDPLPTDKPEETIPAPAVVSTTGARESANNQNQFFEQQSEAVAAKSSAKQNGGIYNAQMPPEGYMWSYGADGTRTAVPRPGGSSGDSTDGKTASGTKNWYDIEEGDDPLTKSYKQQYIDSQKAYDDYKVEYDRIKAGTLTPAQQAAIDSIQASIDAQKRKQEEINRIEMGNLTMSGIRSGRARYTSETEDSVFADAQSKGLQRIKDIESEGLGLIEKAKSAFAEKDFKMLNESYEKYQQNAKDKSDAIMNLVKTNTEREKAQTERLKQIYEMGKEKRDQAKDMADFIRKNASGEKPYAVFGGTIFDVNGYPVDPKELIAAGYDLQEVVEPIQDNTAFDTAQTKEYKFYKKDMLDRGLKPLDFDQYQVVDANRKAVRSTTNVYTGGEFGSKEMDAVETIIQATGNWGAAAEAINKKFNDPKAAERYDSVLKKAFKLPVEARNFGSVVQNHINNGGSYTEADWNSDLVKFQQENSYVDPEIARKQFEASVPKPVKGRDI
jgi:hypothetical protein